MEQQHPLFKECARLSNDQLLRELQELTARERQGLVRILTRLSELDRRDLVQRYGHASVYIFCLRRLGYCQGTAFRRTKAAAACRLFPELLDMLEAGRVHLTAVAMLAPYMTKANWRELIRDARGKTTRDLEKMIAVLAPGSKPPSERARVVAVTSHARSLPSSASPVTAAALLPIELPTGTPASPPQIELRTVRTFTCSQEIEAMLEKARQLLWHKYPEGRFEDILREALDALLARRDLQRRSVRERGATRALRGRYIPAAIRKTVWTRDQARCSFIGIDGLRCDERRGMEIDHILPVSLGGRSDDPANLRLLCRAHNQWRARQQFGDRVPRAATARQ